MSCFPKLFLRKLQNNTIFPNPDQNQNQFDIEFKKNILVVDDSIVYLKILHKIISKMGYNVTTTINGREALEYLKLFVFDLLISDIHMPEMDGIELTMAVREILDKKIPIILYSTDKNMESQSIKSGCDIFVLKPFQIEKLENIISGFLS